MKTKLAKERQVSVILRNPTHPFRLAAPCVIFVRPQPGSRVVQTETNSLRAAFLPAEIRIVAAIINRAYPRLLFALPKMCRDQNRNYVPGQEKRPFLAVADDGVVRIGVEIANSAAHPVVQLTVQRNSRVWREGSATAWIPGWTEFRALVAEYAPPEAWAPVFSKPTRNLPKQKDRLRSSRQWRAGKA
jgi:hypothetical protein